MADAKKCDICGKFYVSPLGCALYTGRHSLIRGSLGFPDMCYDLCQECNNKLDEFVESLKEKDND